MLSTSHLLFKPHGNSLGWAILSPLKDEETKVHQKSNLPKVTHLLNGRTEI